MYNTYIEDNLRYSQSAALDMYKEVNTGTNLPAQIDLYSVDGDEYKFLCMAKGGGSANKTYLYQETKALITPAKLKTMWWRKCARYRGLSAIPYCLRDWRNLRGSDTENGEAGLHPLLRRPAHRGERTRRAFRDVQLEQELLREAQNRVWVRSLVVNTSLTISA